MSNLHIPIAAPSSSSPAGSAAGNTLPQPTLSGRVVAALRQHIYPALRFLHSLWPLPFEDKKLHILAVLAALRAWWRSHCELTTGDLCVACDDVHADGDACRPDRMRYCLDCGRWRTVTKAFTCAVDAKHHVHPRFRRPEVTPMTER